MKSFLQFLILSLLTLPLCYAQWNPQFSGVSTNIYAIYFFDENNGWAAGANGVFLRSTDDGSNWNIIPIGTTVSISDIKFFTLNDGIIIGNGGLIKKTTDGGINWFDISSGVTSRLLEFHFINSNVGWIGGDNGLVLKTTDGGTSWITQATVITDNINGIWFINENVGWVSSELNGEIWKTTDGGTNWNQKYETPSNYNLWQIQFVNLNEGWATGEAGLIVKSTDSGENWIEQNSGTSEGMFGCFFYNNNHGWAVGKDENIVRTSDGGENWIVDRFGPDFELYCAYFLDDKIGWTTGSSGTILHTKNWGGFPFQSSIWSNQITIEDAGGREASEVLTFGQHVDATDSIDATLGEYELPPPPPTGIFDSRFNLPTNPVVSSFIDYRDSTKSEIIWPMTFQPGPAGYPMTFTWDSTSFPEGTFYLKDLINGSFVFVNMKEQSSYTLTESAITSLNISYRGLCSSVSVNNGWNIISVPFLAEDMSVSNLFSTATSPAYRYDIVYVTEDTLAAGQGYWLKFDGNEEIQICGSTLGDTVQVKEGWNMFGPFEEDIPVSQVTTTPLGIVATFFFGFEDVYYIADTLKSGRGYWVRVTEDGVLNLNGGTLEKDGEERQPIAKLSKDWGRIKITDSEGKSVTLYATEEEIESDFYELPPMPPTGIFDARYSNGKIIEDLSNEQIIQISSDDYPITIKAEGLSLSVRDMINGEMLNEKLKNGEDIRITNNKITSIVVTGKVTGGLPITYELYQNYPNPFNPTTTIKFAIPKETNVNLSIYNILGERVKELKNGIMKPGYYEYEFNGINLPSGVYFYSLSSGDFKQTKKLILLK